jgi:uncharacterized RmlC-like cupin family protein
MEGARPIRPGVVPTPRPLSLRTEAMPMPNEATTSEPIPASDSPGIVVSRPDPAVLSAERLEGFVGISAESGGARGLSMQLVVVPPGAVAQPHFHPHHETILYLLNGEVEVLSGPRLEHRQLCQGGDFVMTPAGVVHAPRNLSLTDPVYLITARNDPREHEESTPYPAR